MFSQNQLPSKNSFGLRNAQMRFYCPLSDNPYQILRDGPQLFFLASNHSQNLSLSHLLDIAQRVVLCFLSSLYKKAIGPSARFVGHFAGSRTAFYQMRICQSRSPAISREGYQMAYLQRCFVNIVLTSA